MPPRFPVAVRVFAPPRISQQRKEPASAGSFVAVVKPYRLAEVDATLLLKIADELDHVQGVDPQVIEGGVFGYVLGVYVDVRFENFFNGIKRSH